MQPHTFWAKEQRTARAGLALIFLLLAAMVTRAHAAPEIRNAYDHPSNASILESYGKLPMSFEANEGQANSPVKFLSRGDGYSLFLSPTEALLSLRAYPKTFPTGPLSRSIGG